jgi:predicted small secreted protein
MKRVFFAMLVALALSACGTVKGTAGGFLEGAGQDLSRAGEWIKEK